jgi:hypothetical protein
VKWGRKERESEGGRVSEGEGGGRKGERRGRGGVQTSSEPCSLSLLVMMILTRLLSLLAPPTPPPTPPRTFWSPGRSESPTCSRDSAPSTSSLLVLSLD